MSNVLRLLAMLCSALPANLFAWLAIMAQAVPARSTITFLELLVGAMITDRGFVTEAILAIDPRRKWHAYYKWLEAGHWSWVAVSLRLCRLLVANFSPPIWYLIIDDTLLPRASKKAPGVGIQAQQIIEAYALRWTIEPMFKCQHLGHLGSEMREIHHRSGRTRGPRSRRNRRDRLICTPKRKNPRKNNGVDGDEWRSARSRLAIGRKNNYKK